MTGPDHSLRDYQPDAFPGDRDALLRMVSALQEFERALRPHRRLGSEMAAEQVDALETAMQAGIGRIVLACRADRVVGFIAVKNGADDLEQERRELWIEDLYIVAEERGRGLARLLVQAAEDHARILGIRRVVIGTLHANTRAQDAYAALGYRPAVLILERHVEDPDD
ncbi:GNAT family N-acetyltransferase [Zavarzinia sp. CC-PAN008]|uniref:GNAT family N-acetyltransferase n=1 Tax=Zavarzinia sp. CC-PAN008 TaxID=3243332 RepID=UPI003F748C93